MAVTINAEKHGVRALCNVLAVPRSTYYRKLRPWHGPRRWTPYDVHHHIARAIASDSAKSLRVVPGALRAGFMFSSR